MELDYAKEYEEIQQMLTEELVRIMQKGHASWYTKNAKHHMNTSKKQS